MDDDAPQSAASHASFAPFETRAARLQELQSRATPAPPPPAPATLIAGFWRRVAAYLIDRYLVLGLGGYLLGMAFFNQFAGLAHWGRPAGYAVALLYFALLDSSLGGGQTLGKRLMKIKVVDERGGPLPLPWAAVRYAVLAIPFLLNGWLLPSALMQPWVAFLMSFTALALGAGGFYLLVFNRSTRQSLHDLAVGAFVVRADSQAPPPARPLWAVHTAVLVLWCVVSLWLASKALPQGGDRDLIVARQEIEQLEGVRTALVVPYKVFGSQSLIAVVDYAAAPASFDDAVAEVADTLVSACSQRAPEQDAIVLQLRYGYDLGLCFSWKKTQKVYAKAQSAEWNKLIKGEE